MTERVSLPSRFPETGFVEVRPPEQACPMNLAKTPIQGQLLKSQSSRPFGKSSRPAPESALDPSHLYTPQKAGPMPIRRTLLIVVATWISCIGLSGFTQTTVAGPPADNPKGSLPSGASSEGHNPAGKSLSYDVVSIKAAKDSAEGGGKAMPDGFSHVNQSLPDLIGSAYGTKSDLISGLPGWATSAHYDIQAKVAEGDIAAYGQLRGSQLNRMLQAILQDRFKLVVHTETKDLPIYDLVIANSGFKLHEANPSETYPNGIEGPDGQPVKGPDGLPRSDVHMVRARGLFVGQRVPVGALLGTLSSSTGRNVIDKTGLTGKYDITLRWAPAEGFASEDTEPGGAGPSIFTALKEQLGLELQSAKGPVKTLVVDHIERPSEN
jgi:uncharacterized protein (TIGR03435 family)